MKEENKNIKFILISEILILLLYILAIIFAVCYRLIPEGTGLKTIRKDLNVNIEEKIINDDINLNINDWILYDSYNEEIIGNYGFKIDINYSIDLMTDLNIDGRMNLNINTITFIPYFSILNSSYENEIYTAITGQEITFSTDNESPISYRFNVNEQFTGFNKFIFTSFYLDMSSNEFFLNISTSNFDSTSTNYKYLNVLNSSQTSSIFTGMNGLVSNFNNLVFTDKTIDIANNNLSQIELVRTYNFALSPQLNYTINYSDINGIITASTDEELQYFIDLARQQGYQQGLAENQEFNLNWLSSIFSIATQFFNIEILPGFKLIYLIAIPLFLSLGYMILKIFR